MTFRCQCGNSSQTARYLPEWQAKACTFHPPYSILHFHKNHTCLPTYISGNVGYLTWRLKLNFQPTRTTVKHDFLIFNHYRRHHHLIITLIFRYSTQHPFPFPLNFRDKPTRSDNRPFYQTTRTTRMQPKKLKNDLRKHAREMATSWEARTLRPCPDLPFHYMVATAWKHLAYDTITLGTTHIFDQNYDPLRSYYCTSISWYPRYSWRRMIRPIRRTLDPRNNENR